MVDEREALRERTKAAIRGWLQSRGMAFVSDETAAEGADAVLAVLPSRETVARTEEWLTKLRDLADEPEYLRGVSDENLTDVQYGERQMARAVRDHLALFPGESRERVQPREDHLARALAASFGVGWHDRGPGGTGREWGDICTETAHDLLMSGVIDGAPREVVEAKARAEGYEDGFHDGRRAEADHA